MSSEDCEFALTDSIDPDGHGLVQGKCVPCGIPVLAASHRDAIARFEEHRDIPAPPAEVLSQPVTVELIDDYPAWFINGRGYKAALATKCPHGESLLFFCASCR